MTSLAVTSAAVLPTAAETGGGGAAAAQMVMLLGIVVLFWVLLVRPQKRRQAEMAKVQGGVAPGDRILTTAGMFATVIETNDEGVLLEIAPGVQARYLRQAVLRVVEPAETPAESPALATNDDPAPTTSA
jgi:preprotein translocase subunit YajC